MQTKNEVRKEWTSAITKATGKDQQTLKAIFADMETVWAKEEAELKVRQAKVRKLTAEWHRRMDCSIR